MKGVQFSVTGAANVLSVTSALKPPTLINNKSAIVRNIAVGVNYIDTYHRSGLYPVTLPYTPGREGAGIIEQLHPENASTFRVGDRVAYLAANSAAELVCADTDYMVKLPDDKSFEQGAGLLLQGLTAFSLTTMAYNVKPGDSVLIHAVSGGTGQLIARVCKKLGATTIIGTTSTSTKAETAKKLGVDHVLLYKDVDVVEEVLKITNGTGVDVVFDGVGATTFDISRKSLKRLGFLLSFGNASGKVADVDIMKLVPNAIRLMRPSLFQFIKSKDDFDFLAKPLMEMFKSDKFKINIFAVYPMEDVAKAHHDLESGKTQGKLILKV